MSIGIAQGYMHDKVRVEFYYLNRDTVEQTPIDAVWCSDLYREQIDGERNGTLTPAGFEKFFGYTVEEEKYLICPNTYLFS